MEPGEKEAVGLIEDGEGSVREVEAAEQVMSEVHLCCPPHFSGPCISRFTFAVPQPGNLGGRYRCPLVVGGTPTSQMLCLDEDGDLVLTRRERPSLNCEVTIQHRIMSSIPSVGLQLWKAALLLADFVLHTSFTSSEFDDITALELGAGTGLVGILLGRVAETVYITDSGVEILDNCVNNVHLNSNLFKFPETSVCVRELDWGKAWPPVVENCSSQQRSGYSWTSPDIEGAERASVLLAADVIYNDELTDSFFRTLEILMSRSYEKVLYLATEKRYNFSLNDLDIIANGYLHFRSFLHDEEEYDAPKSPSRFMGKQIDISEIPQYIKEYDRGKDLELWKITYATSD